MRDRKTKKTKTLEDRMIENAFGPKSVSSEVGNTTQHSIHEQIELDKYLNKKELVRSGGLGIRTVPMRMPGVTE